MNKFKEQVWVDSHMDCVPCFYEPLDEKSVSYTRTDVAQAMVAAAYLDAGNLHQSLWCETSAYRTDQIIKRTPTDAKAALDRIVQEAVKEALDNARGAVLAEKLFDDLSTSDDHAYNTAIDHAAQAIAALKGGEA